MAQEQTILPKGIVLNSHTIYEDIAKYDVVPVERILKAVQVFSTTSRKLYDPTARRLENFWSRVLGGDRRYLSGRMIAQLFKDISDETSFVKLRGPDNRYEPPSPKSSASRSEDVQAASSTSAARPQSKPTASPKAPHPILKKPRGPSASGPRPTARFVSPVESEVDEDESKPSGTNGPATAATPGKTRSNTNEERKKGTPVKAKKKTTAFVASSSSRRRPGMPRRSSSQSSAGASETGSKDVGASPGSRYEGSVPTIFEKPEQQQVATKKSDGNAELSAKAAGKRPVVQTPSNATIMKSGTGRTSQPQSEAPAGKDAGICKDKTTSRPAELQGNIETPSKPTPSVAVPSVHTQQSAHPEPSRSLNRVSSDTVSARPVSRDPSRTFVPPSSLMSTSLAKVDTSVIVQGTLSKVAEDVPSQSRNRPVNRSDRSASNQVPGSPQSYGGAGYGGAAIPHRSNGTPSTSLSRSKSQTQLSFILDHAGKQSRR
ncbi:hypothetical protein F4808DRAFT_36220 [Astrocystis sublimbata]|nr:hypothetical protein F4808DRAFT_36220 [Astrocystis sublimbata]